MRSVAWRLRLAFAAAGALLLGVLAHHAVSVRDMARGGRALGVLSAHAADLRDRQPARLRELNDLAAKFSVTGDVRYLAVLKDVARLHGDGVRAVHSVASRLAGDSSSAPPQRYGHGAREAREYARAWNTVEVAVAGLALPARELDSAGVLDDEGPQTNRVTALHQFEQAIDEMAEATRRAAVTIQTAIDSELAESESRSRRAALAGWLAGGGALVVLGLLSYWLAVSIVRPVERLKHGTHQVAAGRFDFRLDEVGRDELAQVARDFNRMTARLEDLERAKRDFLSRVSHDLKTPLSSIRETTAVLLDEVPGPLNERQRRLLRLSGDSADRLSGMISRLLDYSRNEATAGIAIEERVDVLALAARATERHGAAHGVALSHYGGEAAPVVGDSAALEQLLDNLLDNALKFSPAGTPISVTVAVDDHSVQITVADMGPGVADADKERVFEPFFQTPRGRELPGRGVGLGLAICRQVARLHGGSIWIADNEPQGTAVHVRLPRAEWNAAGGRACVDGAAPPYVAEAAGTVRAAVAAS